MKRLWMYVMVGAFTLRTGIAYSVGVDISPTPYEVVLTGAIAFWCEKGDQG